LMSDTEVVVSEVWVPRTPSTVPCSSLINLTNLLLRETSHRVATLQRCDGPDPEIFVVSRIDWHDKDSKKPLLSQLPRVLSLLETLRGTRGVPREIHLDNNDGIVTYLPTGINVSGLPKNSRDAVMFLTALVEDTVAHMLSTMKEVEDWFWVAARRKGFSPNIVERMTLKEQHYDSPAHLQRFNEVIERYFSIRFRIHRSESVLHLEEDH